MQSLICQRQQSAFNNYSQVINFEIYILQERCLKISKYLVYFNLILQTRFQNRITSKIIVYFAGYVKTVGVPHYLQIVSEHKKSG